MLQHLSRPLVYSAFCQCKLVCTMGLSSSFFHGNISISWIFIEHILKASMQEGLGYPLIALTWFQVLSWCDAVCCTVVYYLSNLICTQITWGILFKCRYCILEAMEWILRICISNPSQVTWCWQSTHIKRQGCRDLHGIYLRSPEGTF